jgi:hypothetical protein
MKQKTASTANGSATPGMMCGFERQGTGTLLKQLIKNLIAPKPL